MRRRVFIYINVEDDTAKGTKVYSKGPTLGSTYRTIVRFKYTPSWIPNTDDRFIDPLRLEDIQDITVRQLTTGIGTKYNLAPPCYIKIYES